MKKLSKEQEIEFINNFSSLMGCTVTIINKHNTECIISSVYFVNVNFKTCDVDFNRLIPINSKTKKFFEILKLGFGNNKFLDDKNLLSIF